MSNPSQKQPGGYAVALLVALQKRGRHVYGGTVPQSVVQQRRAANKVARRSRRVNRGQR